MPQHTATAKLNLKVVSVPTLRASQSILYIPRGKTTSLIPIAVYTPDHTKVLKIDAAGKITALNKGKVKITATVGGVKKTVTIKVK